MRRLALILILILILLLAPVLVAQDDNKAPTPPAPAPSPKEGPAAAPTGAAPRPAPPARRGSLIISLLLFVALTVAVLGTGLYARRKRQKADATRATDVAVPVVVLFILAAAAAWWLLRTPREPDESVSFLDQPFGAQPLAGIEDEGFYGPERSTVSFRWTKGTAKLVVPLHGLPPKAMHVRLILPGFPGYRVCIQANGRTLFDEGLAIQGSWARTFDLSTMNLGKALTLDIISDTFVPAEKFAGSTDTRRLGVRVVAVTLFSGAMGYTDVPLGVQQEAEVPETGFHRPEIRSGQRSRWTNGAARLTVPLGSQTPRVLALSLEIPHRPEYCVMVTVNGHILFEDLVPPNSLWSKELPLTDVRFEGSAHIELGSSTFVPADVGINPKDKRTLGVNVKRLMLLTALTDSK